MGCWACYRHFCFGKFYSQCGRAFCELMPAHRVIAPATPPKEGNVPILYLCRYDGDHPVRRGLPPLRRRGTYRHCICTDPRRPPRQAKPATPPKEGNVPTLYLYRPSATTPSGGACHPSEGGECTDTVFVQTLGDLPVRRSLPPLRRRGIVRPYIVSVTRRFYLRNACSAASNVCSKTSVSCANETKHASYGDGGK